MAKHDTRMSWLLGLAAAQLLLLLVLVFQVSGMDAPMGEQRAGAGVDLAGDAIRNEPAAQPSGPSGLSDDDPIKGDQDAPVTIVEFSDYECPFCARFYSDTLEQLEQRYIETGQVKFQYRDFPLNNIHPHAQKAAEAAECAQDQGEYWAMHDLLFERGVSGGVTSFKQYAADIGLDGQEFADCLDGGVHADEVAQDMREGQQLGIRGTPGFLVNGRLISGAQPLSAFEQAIEAELAT